MIFRPELVALILAGQKTVTRRKRVPGYGCKYRVGKWYALQPGRGKKSLGRLRIVSTDAVTLRQIDDADAVREGFASRDEFMAYWQELYGRRPDPSEPVWRIEFTADIPDSRADIPVGKRTFVGPTWCPHCDRVHHGACEAVTHG